MQVQASAAGHQSQEKLLGRCRRRVFFGRLQKEWIEERVCKKREVEMNDMSAFLDSLLASRIPLTDILVV